MRSVAAISAAHGRNAITRAWGLHTSTLGFSSVIVAVTDDEANDENARVLSEMGLTVIRRANSPLSDKFQSALDACPRTDAYMILPSDDFVHPTWMKAVTQARLPYMLPSNMAMYDINTGRALTMATPFHIGGRLKYGACRVFSHAVRKAVNPLWPSGHERGLDSLSHRRIMEEIGGAVFDMVPSPSFVDIKSKDNLWGYGSYEKNHASMDPAAATDHITNAEARALLGLT